MRSCGTEKEFLKRMDYKLTYQLHQLVLQVNYINAHATSTIVGDLAEVNAVKKVFKNTSGIKMNATKVSTHTCALTYSFLVLFSLLLNLCDFFLGYQSMIGHCLGAAGGLEAIATVKAITTGWLHPTINQFVCTTFSF